MESPLLEAVGLTAGYGRQAVVWDLDLALHPGEVVALLGANGAGKTTTLATLAGALPPISGEVRVAGTVARLPLHRRARLGLRFIPETRAVFRQLTLVQNLDLVKVDARNVIHTFPELAPRLHVKAGMLSGGEQQMLAVGRALADKPSVLLADELSFGLAPQVVKRLLLEVQRSAREDGVASILVEERVRDVAAIADRFIVMRRGRIVLECTSVDIEDHIHKIERVYVGADASADSEGGAS